MYMPKSAKLVQSTQGGYMPQSARLVEKPQKTIGGFVENVVGSTGSLIGNTANAILSPVETIKNLVGIVKDPKILVDYYKQRYGKDLVETLYSDPAGVAADLSILLTGGGALASKLGTVGKVGKLSKVGQVASTAGKLIDPFATVGKTSKLALKPFAKVLPKVGEKVTQFAETLPTRGMGNPAKMENVAGVSPIGISELFDKYGITNRTSEEFGTAATKAGQKYAELVEKGSAVDIGKVLNDLDQQILTLNSKAKTSKSALTAMEELLTRRDELNAAIRNSPTGKVKLAKLQEFKTGAQSDMPEGAFAQATAPAGVSKGTKKFYQTLIGNIDEGAPGTKDIGREQSALLGLQKIAKKSSGRTSVRMPVSPFRLASYGASGVVGGLPGIIATTAFDYAQTNPKTLIAASKVGKKVGSTLQKPINLPATPGIVKNTGKTAKALRLVNFPSSTKSPIEQSIQVQPTVKKQEVLKKPLDQSTISSPMVQPKRKVVKVGNNPFQKVSKVSKGSFY